MPLPGVVKWEPYASYNLGRTPRAWVRPVHTGEAGGAVGQMVAALASAGGVVLVWTGLALAWRRFRARNARASRRTLMCAVVKADTALREEDTAYTRAPWRYTASELLRRLKPASHTVTFSNSGVRHEFHRTRRDHRRTKSTRQNSNVTISSWARRWR